MKKNQAIGIIVIIILVFLGIIGLIFFKKGKIGYSPEGVEEVAPEKEKTGYSSEQAKGEGIFALTAKVLKVDTRNNFLIVKSVKDQKELKVNVSDTTKLIKIELPKERSEKGYIITKKTEIKPSEFKKGDYVSIRTSENIAGKTESNYYREGVGRYRIYSGARDMAGQSATEYKYINFDFTPPTTEIR